MQPVRALNRDRIELQRLIDHLRTASRLGHPRQHKARGALSLPKRLAEEYVLRPSGRDDRATARGARSSGAACDRRWWARRGARRPGPRGHGRDRCRHGRDQDRRRARDARRPDGHQPFGGARGRAAGNELLGRRAPSTESLRSSSFRKPCAEQRASWEPAACFCSPPAREGDRSGASRLLCARRKFESGEIAGAQLAAANVGLVLRAFGAGNGAGSR